MWLARDKYNILMLFADKPVRDGDTFKATFYDCSLCHLDSWMYENITWENSPQKVRLHVYNTKHYRDLADKLQQHNEWRRGSDEHEMMNPTELGNILDETIKILREL